MSASMNDRVVGACTHEAAARQQEMQAIMGNADDNNAAVCKPVLPESLGYDQELSTTGIVNVLTLKPVNISILMY
jgi:hypothetical protein